MKAIQITHYLSTPSELTATAQPDPQPSATEYLIAVSTAATNFFDTLQLANRYQHQPALPFVLGSEFSGTVVRAPAGGRFPAGTRVFGAAQGAYATLVAAAEDSVRRVPAAWSTRDAAGLFVTAPTAYAALVLRAGVRAGEWVLVHAAAGGVGLAAVQVAKALGARVVAAASTPQKRAVCVRFGADATVDYTADGWEADVLRATAGRGADVVFDPVGLVDRSLKCVAWNGRVVVVGFAAGVIESVRMNKVLLKNVAITGVHWGRYPKEEPGAVVKTWEGLERMIAEGKFKPTVFDGERFEGLESVPRALNALKNRSTWGKVLVDVQREEDVAAVRQASKL